MKQKDPLWLTVVIYFVLIFFVAFSVYPVLRVVTISLRPGDQLHSRSLAIIPEGASLASYKTLFTGTGYLRWMLNSAIVSICVTLLGVCLASTAGYAISRYSFRGRGTAMIALITTQMFPVTMLLLPMFMMLRALHLWNTFGGLIIIYSATALPFCVWTMKGYYDTIPQSLEEAAFIDGCNPFNAFRLVVLPLALPALVITALFSFMAAWSEYLVAAVVLNDKRLYTLPLGLKMFQSNFSTEWGLYAAGALIVAVPVMVLFLSLSKWLVGGLTLGSVKG